jgi:hypothetical protein
MEDIWLFDEDGAKRISLNDEFDLDSIIKEGFDRLDDWRGIIPSEPYGVFFKYGMKQGFFSENGSPVQFDMYFTRKAGKDKKDSIWAEKLYDTFVNSLDFVNEKQIDNNPKMGFITAVIDPPPYMDEELDNLLSQYFGGDYVVYS